MTCNGRFFQSFFFESFPPFRRCRKTLNSFRRRRHASSRHAPRSPGAACCSLGEHRRLGPDAVPARCRRAAVPSTLRDYRNTSNRQRNGYARLRIFSLGRFLPIAPTSSMRGPLGRRLRVAHRRGGRHDPNVVPDREFRFFSKFFLQSFPSPGLRIFSLARFFRIATTSSMRGPVGCRLCVAHRRASRHDPDVVPDREFRFFLSFFFKVFRRSVDAARL